MKKKSMQASPQNLLNENINERLYKAYHKLINTFILTLKHNGFMPGRFYRIIHHYNTAVFVFPLSKRQAFLIAVHYSTRQWYNPPSRYFYHKNALAKAKAKAIKQIFKNKQFKPKIVNETNIYLARYTKTVKGKYFKLSRRETFMNLVFNPLFYNWFNRFKQILLNWLHTRIRRLRSQLDQKNVKPFGEVKTILDRLSGFAFIIHTFK